MPAAVVGAPGRTGAGAVGRRMLWESSAALGARWRVTVWMPVLGALALWAVIPQRACRFPGAVLSGGHGNRNAALLASPRGAHPDFRPVGRLPDLPAYPRIRVFFDGRSDFYGEPSEKITGSLLAERRCREVMARYGFTVALLPLDWPLGQILERDPEWRVAVPRQPGGAAGADECDAGER